MRKSRILTFLFALWPGAGQMYLGYMKRGVSLMGVFCLLIAITGFLNLSFLFFLLPVNRFHRYPHISLSAPSRRTALFKQFRSFLYINNQ